MRITAFVQLRRTLTPTGVGVHIIQMMRGLEATAGIDLKLLVSKQELEGEHRIHSRYPLSDMPCCAYPFSRGVMEHVWRLLKFPKAERWAGEHDWLYCPAEAYVPTRRAKLAVTVHDMYPSETNLPWSDEPAHRAKRKRWNAMFRAILPNADLLLAVSQFTKQRIIDMTGFDADRIAVIGNGVGEAFFQAGRTPAEQFEHPDPHGRPYLLVVGGLTTRKRGDRVLDTAELLAKRGSDVQVLIAGKSRDQLIERAKDMSNVRLLGYVEDDALPALMRRASALLFLSQYEGFGMPALEAMAAGTPVIVSHHAALPEIVGNAGIIVDPDKINDVADVTNNVLNHDGDRQAHIARGLARAAEFTWGNCVDRLVGALKTGKG